MWRRLRWWFGLVSAISVLSLGSPPTDSSAANTLNVPGDFATIQDAIAAAAPGDTVLVAPGTYQERIDFLGKAIALKSAGGPGSTVIDGGGQGPVVTFTNREGRSSVLQGFTIRGGRLTAGGGAGIYAFGSPTIVGNVITGNSACNDGGGIDVSGAPLIQGNVIANNGASDAGCSGASGGGIFIEGGSTGSTAQVIGNTISGNHAYWGGAIGMFSAGMPTIEDNVISGNSSTSDGGAIWSESDSDAVVVQNLIVSNQAGGDGGGIWFSQPANTSGFVAVNNTLAGNSAVAVASQGSDLWADGYDSTSRFFNNLFLGGAGEGAVYCNGSRGETPVFDHNDAFTPNGQVGFDQSCGAVAGGNGNMSVDPRFVSPGNFQLQAGSAAIDAGNTGAPDLPVTDLDGNPRVVGPAVDLGVYEAGPSLAVATFSPTTVDFGAVQLGSASSASITLTNTGGASLQVSSDLVQTSGTGFTVGPDSCAGTALAPGGSCDIQVEFRPAVTGAWTDTVQVTDSLGVQRVALKGTAVAGQVALSAPYLTFGTVRVGRLTQALTETITNSGGGTLHVSTLTVSGANAGDFQIVNGKLAGCAGATLPAGTTCSVQVAFRPTGTGTRTAGLVITSDDPTSPTSVPLSGVGT